MSSNWKIGVGIPITNNSFRFGRRIFGKLSSDLIGGNSFNYMGDTGTSEGHNDGLVKYLAVGDKITIGPSTHSENFGESQLVTITEVTGTKISYSETIYIKFNQGDPFKGIGTKLPANSTAATSTDLSLFRLFDEVSNQGGPVRGFYDEYRLGVENVSTTVGHCIYLYMPESSYVKTKYRAGFYFQFFNYQSGYLQMNIYDSLNGTWGASHTVTQYTTVDEWSFTYYTVNGPSQIKKDWKFVICLRDGAAFIDDVFMEHAKYTSGEGEGVYTFTDFPTFGSRKYQYVNRGKLTRLSNQSGVISSDYNSGNKLKNLIISASFKDADASLRENLEILLDWQDKGYPLVLHHDIPGIRNNLYGFLTIQETSLTHWSSNLRSFNLIFEEG